MPARPVVLVVDDEEVIRDVFAEVLSDRYDAHKTMDLTGARAVLASQRVDVVVLDWMMADGTTSEPLLAELAGVADAPAVILASVSKDTIAVAARYGIPVLYKPFDLGVLTIAVAEACRRPRRPVVQT